MGLKELVVAINKMDDTSVNYSSDRFEEIKSQLIVFLKKVGYRPDNIPFVPISGLIGDNLIERSDKMPWYSGPTLIEALGYTRMPNLGSNASKPLRIPLYDCYQIGGIGTVAVGRVEAGTINRNVALKFTPVNLTSRVESIQKSNHSVQSG